MLRNRVSGGLPHKHWNGNAVILTKFLSLSAFHSTSDQSFIIFLKECFYLYKEFTEVTSTISHHDDDQDIWCYMASLGYSALKIRHANIPGIFSHRHRNHDNFVVITINVISSIAPFTWSILFITTWYHNRHHINQPPPALTANVIISDPFLHHSAINHIVFHEGEISCKSLPHYRSDMLRNRLSGGLPRKYCNGNAVILTKFSSLSAFRSTSDKNGGKMTAFPIQWKFGITEHLCPLVRRSSDLSNRISYTDKIISFIFHDDVIKWKHFPRYWPFVRGIHRWPVNSRHKGQ